MIKFFRRIRQNLLSEGKTRKYLKYAIGEIILVVIGILVALQINNWNENRKNNSIEQATLLNLKSDLESALAQLDQKLEQNKAFRHFDSILLDVIYYKKDISADSLEALTLSHTFSPGFDPELGTLNEILSSGKMQIIQNRMLRNHVSTWNKYMDELEEVDEKLAHYDLQVKDPLYSKHLPYKNVAGLYMNNKNDTTNIAKSNFEWNSKVLLQNKEFENMLSNYIIYSIIQYSRLLDIKKNINDMISLIDSDIKDN